MTHLFSQLNEHAYKGLLATLGFGATGKSLVLLDFPPNLLMGAQFTMYILASIVSVITIYGFIKKTFFKK